MEPLQHISVAAMAQRILTLADSGELRDDDASGERAWKPPRATSSAILRPASRITAITPSATRLSPANIAVGRVQNVACRAIAAALVELAKADDLGRVADLTERL
jgi:hypothetical protein